MSASTGSEQALDQLCRRYWRPVYVYVRATGVPPHEAEDATQDFFADMLRRDWLKRADPDRGRFRALLRVSVKKFLSNRWRRESAVKRGSGERAVPLNSEQGEQELAKIASATLDAADVYERSWADCVLQGAREKLAEEQRRAGHGERFEKLQGFLTRTPSPGDYAQLCETLRLTESQIAVAVHRLSRRFAALIRTEVASTVADRAEIESELRHLLKIVSAA